MKEKKREFIFSTVPYFLKKSSKSLNYSPIDFIFEKNSSVSFSKSSKIVRRIFQLREIQDNLSFY